MLALDKANDVAKQFNAIVEIISFIEKKLSGRLLANNAPTYSWLNLKQPVFRLSTSIEVLLYGAVKIHDKIDFNRYSQFHRK